MAKADVSGCRWIPRRTDAEADFASTRGEFKFAANQHPVQKIFVREVIKEGDVFTNKIIGTALEDHANVYVDECKM